MVRPGVATMRLPRGYHEAAILMVRGDNLRYKLLSLVGLNKVYIPRLILIAVAT